ncbi:hypothetical protein B0H19DRAFT_1085138 [Mycena capillaripes]|nr:hypothetical protein B0H19DRAFT_1085138 [Mycena capillaripes]
MSGEVCKYIFGIWREKYRNMTRLCGVQERSNSEFEVARQKYVSEVREMGCTGEAENKRIVFTGDVLTVGHSSHWSRRSGRIPVPELIQIESSANDGIIVPLCYTGIRVCSVAIFISMTRIILAVTTEQDLPVLGPPAKQYYSGINLAYFGGPKDGLWVATILSFVFTALIAGVAGGPFPADKDIGAFKRDSVTCINQLVRQPGLCEDVQTTSTYIDRRTISISLPQCYVRVFQLIWPALTRERMSAPASFNLAGLLRSGKFHRQDVCHVILFIIITSNPANLAALYLAAGEGLLMPLTWTEQRISLPQNPYVILVHSLGFYSNPTNLEGHLHFSVTAVCYVVLFIATHSNLANLPELPADTDSSPTVSRECRLFILFIVILAKSGQSGRPITFQIQILPVSSPSASSKFYWQRPIWQNYLPDLNSSLTVYCESIPTALTDQQVIFSGRMYVILFYSLPFHPNLDNLAVHCEGIPPALADADQQEILLAGANLAVRSEALPTALSGADLWGNSTARLRSVTVLHFTCEIETLPQCSALQFKETVMLFHSPLDQFIHIVLAVQACNGCVNVVLGAVTCWVSNTKVCVPPHQQGHHLAELCEGLSNVHTSYLLARTFPGSVRLSKSRWVVLKIPLTGTLIWVAGIPLRKSCSESVNKPGLDARCRNSKLFTTVVSQLSRLGDTFDQLSVWPLPRGAEFKHCLPPGLSGPSNILQQSTSNFIPKVLLFFTLIQDKAGYI